MPANKSLCDNCINKCNYRLKILDEDAEVEYEVLVDECTEFNKGKKK